MTSRSTVWCRGWCETLPIRLPRQWKPDTPDLRPHKSSRCFAPSASGQARYIPHLRCFISPNSKTYRQDSRKCFRNKSFWISLSPLPNCPTLTTPLTANWAEVVGGGLTTRRGYWTALSFRVCESVRRNALRVSAK